MQETHDGGGLQAEFGGLMWQVLWDKHTGHLAEWEERGGKMWQVNVEVYPLDNHGKILLF